RETCAMSRLSKPGGARAGWASVRLTVIVPTLNAEETLAATLASIHCHAAEVIVGDGGSTDRTRDIARHHGATVLTVPTGRGRQLAAAVAAAHGDWLLLLHADTQLTPVWPDAVGAHMATDPTRAGYFRFALDNSARSARWLEQAVAWRCRLFSLPYGDQGLLIHRDLLDDVGGIRPLPLMEDVDLALRLGAKRLTRLAAPAVTSAAKWERDGWLRRSARNLCCLVLFFLGVAPERIARIYR
ncbi:MAG: TIGR04283 family arsenosugar biosynthesis glycosyltransferase, partial [Acetobacteraceae bacterium]